MSEILDLNKKPPQKTLSPNGDECFRCFLYLVGLTLLVLIIFIATTVGRSILFPYIPFILTAIAIIFILILVISVIGFQQGLKSIQLKEPNLHHNSIGLIGNGCISLFSILLFIIFFLALF